MISRFGRGPLWPLRRDGRGDFASADGNEKLRNNLALILATRAGSDVEPGELPWRPRFGSALHRLKHEPGGERTVALANHYARDAFGKWERRVRVLSVGTSQTNDNGRRMDVVVRYEAVESRGDVAVAEVSI